MNWPMYRRVERQAVRMHEMMDRLGIDPLDFARLQQGEIYAEARARCLFCAAADECLRWLESASPAEETPAFCPNRQLFDACRKRAPRNESAPYASTDVGYWCSAKEMSPTEALNTLRRSSTIVRT